MADRIKGITVLIEGDTIGLEKALKGVNQTSKKLQGELKDVQRLLKFDPNNTELLAQKQKLLTDEIENTSKKLNTLKEAEKQVQEQFEKGEIKQEQYRAFQRELAQTQNSLRAAQSALQNMDDEQKRVQKSTQQLSRLFEITESSVEDYADVLGTRLVRAIQNGTATSRDLQTAFNKIGAAATGSKDNVAKLAQEIEKIDSGVSSVEKARKAIQKLGDDAKDSEGKISGVGDAVVGIAAGAAGGAGAGAVVQKALDADTLDTKIDISFDVDDKGKAAVKDAYYAITAYGVDGEAALEGVRRAWILNGDATDAENQKIVKSAGVISRTYAGIDFTELIQETSEFGEALGIGQQGAIDMTNELLKMGFPPEQIDILSEYGSQLQRAGYDATEIQQIFASGIETKSWNIDNLMDGLKEGRVRITEFGTGVDDTTAKLIEGTGISQSKLKEWGAAIAEGGDAGKTAMMDVSLALAGIEDDTLRNKIGVQLFGTMWEDQGSKITDTIIGAKDETANLTTNTNNMNDAISKTDNSSQVELNQALRDMNEALMPLYTMVADFVTQLANWVQQNPQIAAGIGIVTGAITLLFSAITLLTPVFRLLAPVFRLLGVAARIVAVAIAGISAPAWGTIAVIAGLIAIGYLIIANWDKIVAAAKRTWNSIVDELRRTVDAIKENMNKAWTTIKDIWGKIESFFEGIDLAQIGKDIIQGLINGIKSMASNVASAASDIGNGIADKVKSILKLGSPSKLMIGYGENTGEGFAIGLKNSMSQIKNLSKEMAISATPNTKATNVNTINTGGANGGKSLVVNLNSPKALDVREANRQFNRTLNKMSLMW
jgi:phage-related minor tail protein